MIFVLVGIKNSVEVFKVEPEHLLPEVGTGIYHKAKIIHGNVNGGPQAFIPKIY